MEKRICKTCNKPLPQLPVAVSGYYCCDEYYCSKACLDKSFEGEGETWEEHYSDDGDCYWTEWELSDIFRDALSNILLEAGGGFDKHHKAIDAILKLVGECEHGDYEEFMDGSGRCNICGAQLPAPPEEL